MSEVTSLLAKLVIIGAGAFALYEHSLYLLLYCIVLALVIRP